MPFCYSPWTNVDISPDGALSPCCKYQNSQNSNRFNIKNNTIEQYKNSDFLNSIKESFAQNQWPPGCERCKIEEENNIQSKRQLDHDRWQHAYDQINLDSTGFITASIAFGNTCNLTCITCGPRSSSRWQQEYSAIYHKKILPLHFYKQSFVDDFVKQAPEIIHLDIPGGEPFLSGIREQKQLLEYYIDSGRAGHISLHYTTNATVYPDDSWWKLWEHFKEIDLQISIDGVENRFEYIRFPAEWKQVEKNIRQYVQVKNSNFRLSVSHTVSAYNIYYLDEFFSWAVSEGLPRPWQGRVHKPEHMRPSVWYPAAREFIVAHLLTSQHQDAHTWANLIANTDDSDLYDIFKQRCQDHDTYRKLNFKDTFPEMAPYI